MRKRGVSARAIAWLLCVSVWILTMTSFAPTAFASAVRYGDLNGDHCVDMADAAYLYQYNSGIISLTLVALQNADVNDDGCIDSKDSLALYRIASGEERLGYTASSPVDRPGVSPQALYGIDVSYAQGEIDWAKVKKAGVDFAVLRCGYGQDDPDQDDERWEENAEACEYYGIPYGAYFFCYARTVQEAKGEAQHALRLLEGKSLTLPVFYDMEYSSWQGDLTNAQYAAIAKTFCQTLQAAGYNVGVYANLDWWETRLTDPCFDQWYRWVAQYNEECDYEGTYHLWQFSDAGTVDGIEELVDENVAFIDLALLSEAISEE